MASTPRSNSVKEQQSTSIPDMAVTSTVSCVLAVDGGERLGKDWPNLASSYVTAILRQLSNVHPNAEVQVAPMIINSLPPTSKRPLVLRPFRPVVQAMAELPGLLGGSKGKHRESTSDQDYALLEGLLVASSILEAQQSTHSYIVLVSAQDIPNTNFWDEDLPGTLPIATVVWPEIGPSAVLDDDEGEFNTSQGWQRLIQELSKTRTHFCTITTRFLPRLEDLQRKIAAANNLPSQALPNLQNTEHAILLTGFQTGVPAQQQQQQIQQQQQQQKRPHADSLGESPRDGKDSMVPAITNGQNKRVKLSPNIEARKLSLEQQPKASNTPKSSKAETPQQQQQPSAADNGQSVNMSSDSNNLAYAQQQQQQQQPQQQPQQQQSPNKILLSLANAQGSSQGPMDASAVFQPQQQQIQELVQQPFSVQDIQQKREEVKSQMKSFLTSLSSMAKAKQFSMEQARAAAEQVRAEAVKKLQLLDRLEQQLLARSPNFNALGLYPSNNDGSVQQSPAAMFQQLQQMAQQGGQGQGQMGTGQTQQHGQQQQQNIQLPQQLQMQLQAQQQYLNQQQQQQQQSHTQQQQPMFPGHQRTASFSSTTSSNAFQATPGQSYSQVQAPGSTTPNLSSQTPQQQNKNLPSKVPQSPSKAPPVWSGPIQWSLVDPQTKQKRELAFYVDAIPMRSNAVVEMMNLQWPQTLEIAHISGMPMTELQKYASDNRIQVIQFVKASPAIVESMGMTMGQNDSLYKLLAKSLEDKSSVATIKLPAAGPNRGIVVVALPGQAKLVGLLFLHSTLPPRTPAGQQPDLEKQQQQQSQQQQVQPMQRNNSRSQDSQQMPPPLPSPSFQQQSLQPFLQQMQMPQQYQQGQQKTTPNPLYAAPNQQQFNSPGFQGGMPLPQAQPMLAQGMAPMPTNNFNFNMQAMQNSSNSGQAPPMSDAQFQELLASLQK